MYNQTVESFALAVQTDYIQLWKVEKMMNSYQAQFFPILDIQPETEIGRTFTLAYDKPLVCGQFLELSVPGPGEAFGFFIAW